MSEEYVTSVVNKALLKEVAKLCTTASHHGWDQSFIPKVKALLAKLDQSEDDFEICSLLNGLDHETMKKMVVMGIMFFNKNEETSNTQILLQILSYTPTEVKPEERELFDKVLLKLGDVFSDFSLNKLLFVSSLTFLLMEIATHPGMLSLVEEAKSYLGQNSTQETVGFNPVFLSQIEHLFSGNIVSQMDVDNVD